MNCAICHQESSSNPGYRFRQDGGMSRSSLHDCEFESSVDRSLEATGRCSRTRACIDSDFIVYTRPIEYTSVIVLCTAFLDR